MNRELQLTLPFPPERVSPLQALVSLNDELRSFNDFNRTTTVIETEITNQSNERLIVDTYINEFWTSRQRAANRLHEVSYRACFKPQLPHFFIRRLTEPGDIVYDPFMGRGTTLLEAALMGRIPFGCDVNPLSIILIESRLRPPTAQEVVRRLAEIDFQHYDEYPTELLVFYHPETLREICSLKKHLLQQARVGKLDETDAWIRTIAVNRLTGHSPGFFSVYTLPPNQAVSVDSQRKINEKRGQTPPRRDVPKLILAKTRKLLADRNSDTRGLFSEASGRAMLLTQEAAKTPQIRSDSVKLVVTSPPFLDIVNYAQDNWLRCWFCGIDPNKVAITSPRLLDIWRQAMTEVFVELERVLTPGGHVAFEVGEVRGGQIKLEETVLLCGMDAGLVPVLVLINDQFFTKTANCWGVDNNRKGTNTNRIVVFQKALSRVTSS